MADAPVRHDDTTTPGFDLEPVARDVGPFPRRHFVRAWSDFRKGQHTLSVFESDGALVALTEHGGTVSFAGEEDLTDYHSPLGRGAADLLAAVIADLPAGTALDLNSLPQEASAVVAAALDRAGISAEPAQHEVAAVLDLPPSFDDYLASLSKKQRHEVRRKHRRFEETAGAPRLVREQGEEMVTRFAAMHRRSSGDKGEFMDADMEQFFIAIESEAGAVVDVLYGNADTPLAMGFGFEDEGSYYLYNSAFEPDASDISPGIVLVGMLIRGAISRHKTRFDFLKGDEVYKFRLGASERPLYRYEAVLA